MAKRRMNKDIREQIVANVLAATIDVEIEAHEKDKEPLGRRLYDQFVTDEARELMEQLPDGFVSRITSFTRRRQRLDAKPNQYQWHTEHFPLGQSMPQPACMSSYLHNGSNDEEMYGCALEQVNDWIGRRIALDRRRLSESERLDDEIRQFRYVEDLVEAVPEIEKHVPPTTKAKQLPVCVSHLKSVLGDK